MSKMVVTMKINDAIAGVSRTAGSVLARGEVSPVDGVSSDDVFRALRGGVAEVMTAEQHAEQLAAQEPKEPIPAAKAPDVVDD